MLSQSYISLNNFLVPMQRMDNLGCFSWGKSAAIVQRYPVFFPICSVFIPPAVSLTLTTNEYRIFNMHTHLGACIHSEGRSGTNKSAQALTRRDRKLFLTLPRQGIEPSAFGYEFRLIELCPPPHVLMLLMCSQNVFAFFLQNLPSD